MSLRKCLGFTLRRSQSFGLYRRLAACVRPEFLIREASPADMAMIEAHFNPDSSGPMQEPSPDVTNFIACRKDKIIGFVQLVRHREDAFPGSGHWLFSLYVWPLYRGMGIGDALNRRVMEQAQEEQAHELSLVVYTDNRAALHMYKKLGFSRIVVPELEKSFAAEEAISGRRRVVMRRRFYE